MVTGQRGKNLLVVNGFSFAKNNSSGDIDYWCCRHRTIDKEPCHARARTTRKQNGLYTITITQSKHNHEPPRLQRTILNP